VLALGEQLDDPAARGIGQGLDRVHHPVCNTLFT
jgi:hypothetical protein